MWSYCTYINRADGKEIKEVARTDVLIRKGYSFDFTRFLAIDGRDFALLICRYDDETKETCVVPYIALVNQSLEDMDDAIRDLFHRSYCDGEVVSRKSIHFKDPIVWSDIVSAIATKVDFKSFLDWSLSSKETGKSSYGFDLNLRFLFDMPVTFVRPNSNKAFSFSTINRDLENMIKKVALDMTVCRELRISPLGNVLSGNAWLSIVKQRTTLKQHKWWLRKIESSRSFHDEPPNVEPGEVAIFNQVKRGLSSYQNYKGMHQGDRDPSSITASNVTLKNGYNILMRSLSFTCSFGGIQIFDIPNFIRLLKMTETYDEVFDACSRFILSRA